MAEPSPLDPFALWRDMVSQFEKGANRLTNETTRSDQFTQGMGKAMSATLAAKKISDEISTRYLTALNLPTRGDIEALGERLLSIEDRLIAMSAAIEQLAGVKISTTSAAPTTSPRRTRKPPGEVPAASVPAVAPKKARVRR